MKTIKSAHKANPTSVTSRGAAGFSTYFQTRETRTSTVKRQIAKYIVDNLLTEGDSILLDSGTSLCPIAEEIAKGAQATPGRTHYTILTHNLRAFQILVEGSPREANLNIVLAGGRYDQDLNGLFGPQSIMAYENFFPRVVLIGISGLIAYQGLFCHGNTEELAVKETIFNKSTRDRVIVADCSKIGISDAFLFGRTDHLRANADNCFVITNQPSNTDSLAAKERFQREIQALESMKIGVRIIDVGS